MRAVSASAVESKILKVTHNKIQRFRKSATTRLPREAGIVLQVAVKSTEPCTLICFGISFLEALSSLAPQRCSFSPRNLVAERGTCCFLPSSRTADPPRSKTNASNIRVNRRCARDDNFYWVGALNNGPSGHSEHPVGIPRERSVSIRSG